MIWRLILLFVCLAAPALAERKVALVIGNADYQFATPLANPLRDAQSVAEKLTALGYDVQLERDLNGQAFRVALGAFSDKALHADLALVYYAGHGIEMAGQNYLIPIDSEMRSEATAQFETVPLEQVLTAVRGAGALGIVMLDACRDNPFANTMTRKSGTRAVSRGLAPVSVEGEGGLVVSFAAQAGNTADDGDGQHSPYAEAFLEVLDQPGLEAGRMFRTLRAKVREKSGGRQVPVEQAQLPDRDVFITPDEGQAQIAPPAPVPQPVAQPAPAAAGPDPMMMFFDAVQTNDSDKLAAFVAAYPDHPRVGDARKLIESLQDDAMWKMSSADGSEAALRRYILVFPAGLHVDQATSQLQALQPAPTPTPAPVPQPAPAPTPAPMVQVSPTFNCNMARSDVEIAICSNAELAMQDHKIVAVFKSALAANRVTKSAQRDWVAARDAGCAGMGQNVYQCVYQFTAARIAELGG